MIIYKDIPKLTAVLMIAVIIFAFLSQCEAKKDLSQDQNNVPVSQNKNNFQYVSKLFNKDKVMEVNIDIDEEEFESLKKNALSKEYHKADITINGEKINNVGIRAKGNSSLAMLAKSGESDRYSFKIKTDEYIKGQNIYGLSKFVFNNNIGDATNMKEYISYSLLKDLGLETPEFSYAHITVNGAEWGLYLGVESLEDEFLERNFGDDYGDLYKVQSANMSENSNESSAGGNLVYTDNNVSSYSEIFANVVLPRTSYADKKRLISIIKNLNDGKDLDECINVSAVLKYLAGTTFLVNLDSYLSGMKQNYYLYEKNGKMQIIPWDFNLAFSGFVIEDADKAVNFPIDAPVTDSMENSPLISKLFEHDEYKEEYHNYLRQIIDLYINKGKMESMVKYVDNEISDYVKKDATAFYSYEQYKKSLPELVQFGKDRGRSVSYQLDGKEPSTDYGHVKSSVNLRILGNQSQDIGGGVPVGNGDITQVIGIMKSGIHNGVLTEEAKEKLIDIGLSEDEMDQVVKAGKMFGSGDDTTRDSKALEVEKSLIIYIVLMFIALIFVMSFRRKRFHCK